jgi:hypothetical protein
MDGDTTVALSDGRALNYRRMVADLLKAYPKTRREMAHRTVRYFFRTGRIYGRGEGPVLPFHRHTKTKSEVVAPVI